MKSFMINSHSFILEVPNFKKKEDKLITQFDKWLYVLKNLSQFQERPAKLQEKVFEKLFSEAEIAKLNKEELLLRSLLKQQA